MSNEQKKQKALSNVNSTLKDVLKGLKDVITGEILRSKFLLRQLDVIILGVILMFIYMNNRNICERSFKEIHQLRKELTNEKYIAMLIESRLLSTSRIGTIQSLIEEHELPLIEENKPSYQLIIKQEE